MISLLLATSLFITPAPGYPGSYNVFYDQPVATPTYPVNRALQAADAMVVGSPVQTATTYNFDDLDQKYPIRTVVPRDQMQLVPIEDRLAQQEYELNQRRQQVGLQGQQLNQRIAQSTYDYDQKILGQAEKATQALGNFDPADPEFEQHFNQFQAQNPLAFQNPGFRQLADRLVSTHQQIRQSAQSAQAGAAKQGTLAYTAYIDAINSGKTPFEAQAIAADAEQQDRIAQARAQEIQQQRNRLAVQGGPQAVGAYDDALKSEEGRIERLKATRAQLASNPDDADLLASFDAKYPNVTSLKADPTIALGKSAQVAQQQQANRPLNRTDYTSLISANNRMVTDSGGYDNLTEEQKQVYDFNQAQANKYIESQGGQPVRREEKAAPNPKIASIADGTVVTQNGVRFRKTNGQFVPIQ